MFDRIVRPRLFADTYTRRSLVVLQNELGFEKHATQMSLAIRRASSVAFILTIMTCAITADISARHDNNVVLTTPSESCNIVHMSTNIAVEYGGQHIVEAGIETFDNCEYSRFKPSFLISDASEI